MECSIILFLAVFLKPPLLFKLAKLRSTVQRLGITANVCNSLRLTACTVTCSPQTAFTPSANGFPLYPLSHKMLFTSFNSPLLCSKASKVPCLSVILAAVMARAYVSTAICRFILICSCPQRILSALSVFLTPSSSTIRKFVLQDARSCFVLTSPINFF